jgi:hypothetical protein
MKELNIDHLEGDGSESLDLGRLSDLSLKERGSTAAESYLYLGLE